MIDNEKYYSLSQIIKDGHIPWIKSLPTLRRWIKKDETLFKTITTGDGSSRRYFIRGSAIKNVLSLAKDGQLKNYGRKPITIK